MNNNLPTTPGSYWWREKDGDEWEQIREVYPHADLELAVIDEGDECTPQQIGGQWAKAHKPDEGIEAWAVFNNRTGSFAVCWEDQEAAQDMTVDFNNMATKDRYTCRKVRVCEVDTE